jgi:hypothetical protein
MSSVKAAKAAKRFRIPPPSVLDPNQRYSLPEAFAALRVSEAEGYRKMSDRELRTFKDGARTFVSGTELIRASRPPNTETAT